MIKDDVSNTAAPAQTAPTSRHSASGGPLGWQADKGRTPAQTLSDAVERFTAKYGLPPTWAEVHPDWAYLTADGLIVFGNRARPLGTVLVGVGP